MPTPQTHGEPASQLREQILSLGDAFFAEQEAGKRFIPGQTYIPCSGKVLDASDLRHLLDASLDLWLTSGRYATDSDTVSRACLRANRD